MTDTPLSRRAQLFLLGFLTVLFLFNFLSRVVLAPLMPVIEQDLGLGHAGAGSFFLMIAAGYATGLFGSGFVSSRITHRQTIALAAVGGGCAFFMVAAAQSLWMIRIGLVLLGAATGIYLPSGMTTITSSVRRENWGKAIGVFELAPALAYITAPLVVEALLLAFSWRGILVLIGGAAILLGMAFLRFSPAGDFTGEAPTPGNIRILGKRPSFWIMAVLFALAITASIGVYSMMPLYLVAERGMDRELANTLVGISRIPVIFMALAAGWISDRFGQKPTIVLALLFSGLMVVLLGLLPDRWALLAVFLQPMLTACFFPAGFTVLARIVPPRARNLSVALTMFVGYLIGGGLVPTILGIFGDANRFGLAFVLVGSLIFLGAFLMLRMDLRDAEEEGSR
jgi:NNP family nitrate/nitrite transporter-like MFS transporter